MSNFLLLLKIIRLEKHFWVVLVLLLSIASQPAATYLNGQLLSSLANEGLFNEYLIYNSITLTGGILAMSISGYFVAQGGAIGVARFRRKIVSEITIKDAIFFESKPTAFLSHVLLSEVNTIQNACSMTLPDLFRTIVLLGCNCIIAALVKWYFFLVLIGQIIIMALLYIPINRKLTSLNIKKVGADKSFSAAQMELISHWRTVRALGAEEKFKERIDTILREKLKKEKTLQAFQNFVVPLLGFLSAAVAIMFSFWGRILWINGEISIGDIYVIWQAAVSSHTVIRPLTMKINELSAIYASLRNIQQTINFGNQLRFLGGDTPPPENNWEIELKNVRFKYPSSNNYALDSINLTIPANCMTAIVGPSGAGKSTITSIIMELSEPKEGTVLLNGTDLKTISKKQFYSSIGYVPQDVSIFDGTIDENIRLGNQEASLQEVEEATKMAYLHDYIMSLPEGLKTPVGERGVKLSGGQKQRLAIARALIRKPKLLILDEATSALDTHSESCIKDAIEEVSKSITTVVIAHRLSTIKKASAIYVLNNGNIIEKGSYDQLMKSGGVFSNMVLSQKITADYDAKPTRVRSETR